MEPDSAFLRELLDNLYDGVYFVDRNRGITYWNKGAERISGFSAGEVTGRCCKDNLLMHVDEQGNKMCLNGCPLGSTLLDGDTRQAEIYLHHKEGHRIPVMVRVAPIRDASGRIAGAVEIFRDNSVRTADLLQIEELKKLAFLDPLTSLANRRYLELELQSRLEEMARYGWPFGVLFFDVDHFKDVNDRHGHETGDEVLRMVAKTLGACSRVFDTVGRWGGEEFVAVVTKIETGEIFRLAERYRQMVEHSGLPVGGGMLRVTVSAGGTRALPGDTAEGLLRRADGLMYKSKLDGRNRVTVDCLPPP